MPSGLTTRSIVVAQAGAANASSATAAAAMRDPILARGAQGGSGTMPAPER